jgi:hypothetical protein
MGFLRFSTGGPPKTFALWFLVVMGLASVGAALGSWVGPIILVVARDGWLGVSHLPLEYLPFGNLPPWARETGKAMRALTGVAYFVPMVLCFAAFGRCGERLYQYLVVRKLHWMTQEEVDEARKREKQYF